MWRRALIAPAHIARCHAHGNEGVHHWPVRTTIKPQSAERAARCRAITFALCRLHATFAERARYDLHPDPDQSAAFCERVLVDKKRGKRRVQIGYPEDLAIGLLQGQNREQAQGRPARAYGVRRFKAEA